MIFAHNFYSAMVLGCHLSTVHAEKYHFSLLASNGFLLNFFFGVLRWATLSCWFVLRPCPYLLDFQHMRIVGYHVSWIIYW